MAWARFLPQTGQMKHSEWNDEPGMFTTSPISGPLQFPHFDISLDLVIPVANGCGGGGRGRQADRKVFPNKRQILRKLKEVWVS